MTSDAGKDGQHESGPGPEPKRTTAIAADPAPASGLASVAGSPRRSPPADLKGIFELPGLAAISFYLLVLAGVIILGVAAGGRYPPLFLVFSALFIAASGGLLRLFRWAWALALAAVLLLAVYNLWIYFGQREPPALVQGLLNLVFFLYLIRTEVRAKLR